ncbi:MAG: NADH-quinone oxidoreductase subunit N [Anaerolineae bacterium]|nr:NADH-quinone oxidoreductase subunit N [Anaerolineae bacterium]
MQLPILESINLMAVLPVLIIAGWACVLLVFDLLIPRSRKHWTAWLALVGLLGAAVALFFQIGHFARLGSEAAFDGMVTVDGFSIFLQVVFVLTAIVGVLLALDYLPRHGIERGEYYVLLLFTTIGMMIMSMAADLIVVFVALELLSIPLYILSGFAGMRETSEEAALKYFLLGAFASSFLVYGIALTYGGTGTTRLTGIAQAVTSDALNLPLTTVGMGLLLVGLGFKVAAVPFHMWTPDVYQGAPTPVTAFMSVGAKAGGFAALIRVLVTAFPAIASEWGTLIAVIAGLTMLLGNIVAISQSNIKRMLAYSSIAHAGYILLAVAAAQRSENASFAIGAVVFYLLAYALTNLGAFTVAIAVERDDGTGTEIDDFAGLGKTRPWMALAMALFMLSLTGMPISGGLVGKVFVFQAALQAVPGDPLLLAVVIIGVLTSVVSAFYYLKVIMVMYMREGEGKAVLPLALKTVLAATAFGTLVLGIIPGPVFQMAQRAMLK